VTKEKDISFFVFFAAFAPFARNIPLLPAGKKLSSGANWRKVFLYG